MNQLMFFINNAEVSNRYNSTIVDFWSDSSRIVRERIIENLSSLWLDNEISQKNIQNLFHKFHVHFEKKFEITEFSQNYFQSVCSPHFTIVSHKKSIILRYEVKVPT